MPNEKRSSKWDQGPEISQTVTVQQAASEKPVKVSRFDQGPVKSTKWDKCASKWDKLPDDNVLSSEGNGDVARSGIQAASEAAAKVNAMLMAKGVFKPAQPLLVNDSILKAKSVGLLTAGGAVTSEIEINDLSITCRNMLTRGATQEEISRLSGASVSTKGRYMSTDERQSNQANGDKPLHLFVQGATQESVSNAVAKIHEIMSAQERQKGASVLNANLAKSTTVPQPLMSLNPNPTGMAYVQEKLFIGLEHAPSSFDVKNKIQGFNGCYLMHIQNETGAKVILRGKGSGFIEPTSGREAFEPMYIYIQHASAIGMQAAKLLASNLIETVQQEFAQFQQSLAAMPPTILPGTANLLAGLQHQQQGFTNPYTSPYGLNFPAFPAPLSSGLPVLHSNQVAPSTYNAPNNYQPLNSVGQQQNSAAPATPVSSTFLPSQPSAVATCTTASYHSPSAPFIGLPGTLSAPVPPSAYFSQPPTIITPPFPPPSSLPPPSFGAIPVPVPMLLPSVVSPPSMPCAPVPVSVASSKRRFKEEKEDETTDDLLGYQHGTPKVQTKVPLTSEQQVHISEASSSNAVTLAKPSYDESRYSPTRSADEDDEKQLMPPPPSVPIPVPVTRSVLTSAINRSPVDAFVAPIAGVRAPRVEKVSDKKTIVHAEPENKKFKGALISVAMSYTSDDDDDDDDDIQTK